MSMNITIIQEFLKGVEIRKHNLNVLCILCEGYEISHELRIALHRGKSKRGKPTPLQGEIYAEYTIYTLFRGKYTRNIPAILYTGGNIH